MPNRIIRDSLLDSERYLGLAHAVERELFLELVLLADDYGLVPLGSAFLARRTPACSGMTSEQSTKVVIALADVDLIRVYTSESGSRFAYIPRFGNAPRSRKPKWPMPPDAIGGKEIKDLQQKRIANADKCGANAPETETETETEKDKEPTALVALAAPKRLAACPTAVLVGMYHEHLPMLPRVEVMSDQRRKALGARWRAVIADHADKPDAYEASVAWFAKFFRYVARSKFLTGQVKDWKADFDWLMTPSKFVKVFEGRYHKETA